MKLVLQIAAGILLAGLIGFSFSIYMTKRAVDELTVAAPAALKNMQDESRRAAAVLARGAEERRVQRQAQELERKRAEAERTRQETLATMAKLREEQAKVSAWAAFYSPPPECSNPPTWDVQVECGNKHVRAKRDFEARWEAGDLR